MVSIEHAGPEDTEELNRALHEAFSEASVEDFGVEGVIPPGIDDGSMVETAFEDQTTYAIRDDDAVIGGIIVEERPADEMFTNVVGRSGAPAETGRLRSDGVSGSRPT